MAVRKDKTHQPLNFSNQQIVDGVLKTLNDNLEWKSRYESYAKSISKNTEKYKENAKKFRVLSPMYAYSSITKVKNDSTTCSYDLRFAGQSVGTVTVDKKGAIKLSADENQVKCAIDNFEYAQKKGFSFDWKSIEATEYRRCFFRKSVDKSTQIHSQEHRIENWMLAEFAKTQRKQKKLLCNIQPVRLGGKFFQMATPLSASKHGEQPKYSAEKGGGIDILARVKHSSKDHRLAVIELKDENKDGESQAMAMLQALSYATFLAYLLRCKCGEKWWGIFDRHSKLPKELHIDAVTLMPEGKSPIGELTPITIDELGATIHPHTLFYKPDSSGNPIQIFGTLKETLADNGE